VTLNDTHEFFDFKKHIVANCASFNSYVFLTYAEVHQHIETQTPKKEKHHISSSCKQFLQPQRCFFMSILTCSRDNRVLNQRAKIQNTSLPTDL